MDNKFPMTKKGLKRSQKRLEDLKNQSSKMLDRMKDARGNADIPINSDFTLAKDEYKYVEKQIKEMENMLDNVVLIEEGEGENPLVAVGKTVTFRELPDGDQETYTIGGKAEADPLAGIISYESPMAVSLLGKQVGDQVEVDLPQEKIKVEIVDVHLAED